MSVHDFDWYGQRLDVARWENQEVGSRSGFFNCPVHGGSDSLHVTEKNGKALLNCFACGASVTAITEAIEDATPEEPVEPDVEPVTVTRTSKRTSGARGRKQDEPGARGASRGVRLSPASTNPIEWMAQRCGLTAKDLKDFPLSAVGDELAFEFPGLSARKLRGIGEGKGGKRYRWEGASSPPLWPLPMAPDEEIVVCEGEADAICLIHSGYDAYSITKGSQGEVPAAAWEALWESGVRSVWLVFDADDAGRKGRASAAEGARAAGLTVREGRVSGINPLAGEKDARDVAVRLGYPLEVEHDAIEDGPIPLSSIPATEPEELLLGRLHPQEHTILYGDGGTGKGVIAAWWVARLTMQGKKVLIIDYEYHATFEWRPRIEGFGGNMDLVQIVQPREPIWQIAGVIHDWAEGFDYVVVDSVSYACVGEEVEKSVTATKYSMAINQVGKPVLSIAHVTKADLDPNHPFGSIFWSNGARVTIAVSRKVAEDAQSDRVIRNPKTNQRGPFSPVAVKWDWLDQKGPPGCRHVHTDFEPRDQAKPPKHAHLHEESVMPSKSKLVRETFAKLLQETGDEPDGPTILGRIKQDYPEFVITDGNLRKEMTYARKSAPIRRTRVARDSAGTDA